MRSPRDGPRLEKVADKMADREKRRMRRNIQRDREWRRVEIEREAVREIKTEDIKYRQRETTFETNRNVRKRKRERERERDSERRIETDRQSEKQRWIITNYGSGWNKEKINVGAVSKEEQKYLILKREEVKKIETETHTERRTNNKEGTLEREKMQQNNSVFPFLVIGITLLPCILIYHTFPLLWRCTFVLVFNQMTNNFPIKYDSVS